MRLRFELVLVNTQVVRALRGNKTDRIDAARIAEYLLSWVASNIAGKSGRRILAAIVNGRTQPEYRVSASSIALA